MDNIYKSMLFNRNYLVNDKSQYDGTYDPMDIVTSLAKYYGIIIHPKNYELASISMLLDAENFLGTYNVPMAFYRNFPMSVIKLTPDQLLHDQLTHYFNTYVCDNFDEQGYSIYENELVRIELKDNPVLKKFKILSVNDAKILLSQIGNDLLGSTRPLNDNNWNFIINLYKDNLLKVNRIASVNTTIRLLLSTRDVNKFARSLKMKDIIKLVEQLNYEGYNNKNIRKLNLKNKDRKFITSVIDAIIPTINDNDIRECLERRDLWVGLLYHIHYKTNYKSFTDAISGNSTCHSHMSIIEKYINNGDIYDAIDYAVSKKGTGWLLRNMDYLLSRSTTDTQINYLFEAISKSNNPVVLIQLLISINKKLSTLTVTPRTIKFTKFNKVRIHKESQYEFSRRGTILDHNILFTAKNKIQDTLKSFYKNKLGNIYIDDCMKSVAVPIDESSSTNGYGIKTRGTRIPINGNVVRAFVHWSLVNDIDLACFGLSEYGDSKEEFSWRTMYNRQSTEICYSGDQTSGYNGGSEYFDINIDKLRILYPQFRYIVFTTNIYSGGVTYKDINCNAGFMIRNEVNSGEVFEPSTVESAFKINTDTIFNYNFAIDTETNELVWLNIGMDAKSHVAGTNDMSWITQYFNVLDAINVYDLFSMMATNVVDNIDDAELIISDNIDSDIVPVIHSYDISDIMKYMEVK